MKKYWLEIILILAIVAMLCLTCCNSSADEFDSAIMITCPEHGELTEDEVMTLIILGSENYFCMFCAGRFWKNNKAEIRRVITKFEEHE